MFQPRKIDSKGRVMLGAEYSGAIVLIEKKEDGDIVIHLAEVIPQKEAWLYKNKEALASVLKGLEQAKKGQFANDPINFDEDDWLDEDEEQK